MSGNRSFTQKITELSAKPDKGGFKKAKFYIDKTAGAGDGTFQPLEVEGLIFGKYSIHEAEGDVIVSELSSGARIVGIKKAYGGMRERRNCAKAMVKRFPSPINGGISDRQKRTIDIGGEKSTYTVLVIRSCYAQEMSQVIAEELPTLN